MLPPEDIVRLGWHIVPRDLPTDYMRVGWYNIPPDVLQSHDVNLGWFKLTPEMFGGAGRPRITSAATAGGTVGTLFSYQIEATNSPTSFAADGLPPWLSISPMGLITGTPTAQGTTSITVKASNTVGTGSRALSIQIAAAGQVPTIIGATSASGTVNATFSHQVTATGNPHSFAATGLPSTLSINNSGLISGTPTTAETIHAEITATNGYGTSAPHPLSITISTAAVIPQAFYGPLPNGTTVGELLNPGFVRGLAHSTPNPAKGMVLTSPVPAGSQGVCFAYPASLGMAASAIQTPPGFDVLAGLVKTTFDIPPGAADSTPIEYQIIYQRVTLAYSSAVTFTLTI